MAGLGLPTTGRITSGATPKMPAYAARRAPDGRIAGVGLPADAKLIASGSGFGTGQVPASDPYGQLPATAANYHPYEPSTPPMMPATDGSGFVAPGDGIGSAMRYDEATGYRGNDPTHSVNFATGAGMGVEPTNMKGVYRDGNAFSNVPGAPSVAPVRAPLPLAQTRLKAPVSVPVAQSPLAGAAINKAYEQTRLMVPPSRPNTSQPRSKQAILSEVQSVMLGARVRACRLHRTRPHSPPASGQEPTLWRTPITVG